MKLIVLACVVWAMYTSSQVTEYPTFRPVFQPSKEAFGIWAVIFATGLLHGVAAPTGNVLYGLSFLLCGLWPSLYAAEWYRAASVVLGLAWVASAVCNLRHPPSSTWRGTLTQDLGMGLLMGWLTLAFALSVVIATGPDSVLNTPWTFVASSVGLAVVARHKPWTLVPIAWAALWI